MKDARQKSNFWETGMTFQWNSKSARPAAACRVRNNLNGLIGSLGTEK